MNSFGGRSQFKDELIAQAINLRSKGKFANRNSLKRSGFTSLSWLVESPCLKSRFLDFAKIIDIPPDIVYVQDLFFESFSGTHYQSVVERVLQALPVSADLSDWWRTFFLSIMQDKTWSPIRHDVCASQRRLYEQVIELYESENRDLTEWLRLESEARAHANDARTYCKQWSGKKSDPYVQRVLSYDFSIAWLVARACAAITRPSPWWARAVTNRFVDTALANLIELENAPVSEALESIGLNCFPELFEIFLDSLSMFKSCEGEATQRSFSKNSCSVKMSVTDSLASVMTEGEFWTLIDQSRVGIDDQLPKLQDALERLGEEQLLAFDFRFQEAICAAYRWDLWGAAYIINGGCSDDGFDYFLGWLVLQGRKYYEAALRNPNNAGKNASPGDMAECEEVWYVAEQAYEKLTQQADFEDRKAVVELRLVGTPCESDQIYKLFPKLTRKFT
jgi:Protein of unknown function (DUF4240)